MKIARRPATSDDEHFARRLHEMGYHDVVVRQFGQWDEAMQEGYFVKKWFPEKYQILLCEGQPCGCL